MPSSLRQKATTDESTLGTSTVPWEKVFTKDANFSGDVTVEGNLTVTGNATEVTVDKLAVEESMIKVAKVNTGTSADIGVYGVEDTSGTPKYHGLVRDATDSTWKLFEANQEAPNDTTVNFSGTGNVDGTLQAKINLPAASNLKIAGTAVDTTAAELNVLNGVTAGTASASKAVVLDANKDLTAIRNITATGEINAGDIKISGNSITSTGGSAPAFSDVAITGGSVDDVAIGGTTANTGAFTTLTASLATTLNGNVTLGNATGDDITVTGYLASSVIPKADGTHDLGTTALRMRHVYSDNITASTINAFTAGGDIDFNNVDMDNVDIDSGVIDGTVIGATTPAAANVTNLDVSGTAQVDGDLTLSGGDGALTFDAANSSIKIPDNSATALVVEQGNSAYLTFVSTDGSEKITTNKTLDATNGITFAANEIETADITDKHVTLAKIADVAQAKILVGPDGGGTVAEKTVSGDATLAASGALTIGADAVSYTKMQNVATANRLLGSTSADGVITELQVATDMVADDAVTYAKMQNVAAANRLLGSTSAGGIVAELQVATDMVADDQITNAKLANIAQGSIKVGGASNAPTDLDAKTSGQILVGDGTDVVSVAVSGDATLAANGALTIGDNKITNTKLADITRGSIKVGGALDAPTDLNAKGDAKILIGDGTDLVSVAVTGDIAIANDGTTTIQPDSVTNGMLENIAQGSIKVGGTSNAPTNLNAKTDGYVLIGDGTDINSVAVSGDVTIANTGLTAIASNVIVNADVKSDAGIEFSKMETISVNKLLVSDANGEVSASSVTSTEAGYLASVTSSIQTQLDAKQALGADLTSLSSCQTGAAAALALLTSTEVAILDGATVSTTELNHVKDVTSSIQTQIDTKAPVADPTFTGEIGIGLVNVDETELGILEGATLDTTELNYVDGVTSAIQTQLDNKQALNTQLTTLSTSLAAAVATELVALADGEIEVLDGATVGSAVASKALVVDSSRDIDNLGTVTATKFELTGASANNYWNSANGLQVDSIILSGGNVKTSTGDLTLNAESDNIVCHASDSFQVTAGLLTAGYRQKVVRSLTASTNLQGDSALSTTHVITMTSSSATTVDLPNPDELTEGRELVVKNLGAGNLTVEVADDTNIDGAATKVLTQYQSATFLLINELWYTI